MVGPVTAADPEVIAIPHLRDRRISPTDRRAAATRQRLARALPMDGLLIFPRLAPDGALPLLVKSRRIC
jgi:hypothetical protein